MLKLFLDDVEMIFCLLYQPYVLWLLKTVGKFPAHKQVAMYLYFWGEHLVEGFCKISDIFVCGQLYSKLCGQLYSKLCVASCTVNCMWPAVQ